MSLINDALKKAQKQRTGDSPALATLPSVGGEPAAKIAKRDKPVGFNSQLTRLAIGAGGILLVLVIGGFFVVRSLHHPPVAEAKPAAGQIPDGQPAGTGGLVVAAAPVPQPAATLPGAAPGTTPAITFSVPVAPPVREPALAPVSSITTSASSETAPTAAETAAGQPSPAVPSSSAKPAAPGREEGPTAGPAATSNQTPAAVKPDNKSVNYVENLRIAGIRASTTDSKVLMNDHVYRVGDIVERDLGLKLTAITANSLSFVDERGAVYTRDF